MLMLRPVWPVLARTAFLAMALLGILWCLSAAEAGSAMRAAVAAAIDLPA